jgi:pimeloyl-ACP methyl ester carboxylesterase
MEQYATSSDGSKIHYNISGNKKNALVFVHGWLGNESWWNDQKSYFHRNYTVVTLDLAGHGKSDKNRAVWSSKLYSDDINAVAEAIEAENIVLIGHSMSGAFVLEAALSSEKTRAIIFVDTLKNLDQLMNSKQAEEMLFSNYRKDFKDSVENLLPKFLFSNSTPDIVKKRLQNEFLENDPLFAVKLIEPLYKMEIPSLAKSLKIPARSINSSIPPTNIEANMKYFKDYDYLQIENSGHYPMLEKPNEFNVVLEKTLKYLSF